MGRRKEFIGEVVSNKMKKTVVVRVTRIAKHAKYSRVMKMENKFKAHDEKGACQVGDMVKIVETRPISKDKRFMVGEILKKTQAPAVELKEEVV